MPTFQVTCKECGDERWPMAATRPVPYVCVRCTALGPEKRTRRRKAAVQGRKTRQRSSGDATGPSDAVREGENYIPWDVIAPLVKPGMTGEQIGDAIHAMVGLSSETHVVQIVQGFILDDMATRLRRGVRIYTRAQAETIPARDGRADVYLPDGGAA